MGTIFDPRHLNIGVHSRFWLIVATLLAFLMAALWARPVG